MIETKRFYIQLAGMLDSKRPVFPCAGVVDRDFSSKTDAVMWALKNVTPKGLAFNVVGIDAAGVH